MTSITYIISLVLLLMRGYQTHQEAHIYMAARHGDSIMALAGSCSLHWSGQEKKKRTSWKDGKKQKLARREAVVGRPHQAPKQQQKETRQTCSQKGLDAHTIQQREAHASNQTNKHNQTKHQTKHTRPDSEHQPQMQDRRWSQGPVATLLQQIVDGKTGIKARKWQIKNIIQRKWVPSQCLSVDLNGDPTYGRVSGINKLMSFSGQMRQVINVETRQQSAMIKVAMLSFMYCPVLSQQCAGVR